MRTARWSAAAFVMLLSGGAVLFGGLGALAAEPVTMGTSSEPNAFKFAPKEITVPVGSTVVWRNLSDLQHDAKADEGAFKSPLLDKGQEFSFTFKTPGTYSYHCTVPGHADAGMTGVVKVTGGSAPAPPPAPEPAPGPAAPSPPTTRSAGAGATSTTATTARQAATTTTRAAPDPAVTTTAPASEAVTTTTAPAVTPTSAPDQATGTTTTTGPADHEEAAADHGGGGGSGSEDGNPAAIAFAGISTLLLAGVTGKLLAS